MNRYFLYPPTKNILSAGALLRKTIIKKFHAINNYALLPIGKQFEKILRLVKGLPCILLDLDGTILTWNKTFETLQGYSEKEIIGQNFNIFYLPQDRQNHLPEELLIEAAERGRARHFSVHVKKDGTIFWGNIILTAIKNTEGEVLGFTETTEIIPEQEQD